MMVGQPPPPPVVCFGEMLLRLAPAHGVRLDRADSLAVAAGGAEANVAVALASLGQPARMVTVLPDSPLGRRALAALGEAGVDCRFVKRGIGRMGLNFFEPPSGPVAGKVLYDRQGSAFAAANASNLDFDQALAGAALLHLSGITPALGPQGVDLARAAVRAARSAGVPICLDGNYRAHLWDASGCDPRAILGELTGAATILIGNHRDISLLLGKSFSGDGPDRRREAAQAAFGAFPGLQVIASTARHIESTTTHRVAARVDLRESHWQTNEVRIDPVIDRIGTGDAFAAGMLLRWLEAGSAQIMAETGLSLAAMKHGIAGDMIAVTRQELDDFDPDGADVRR